MLIHFRGEGALVFEVGYHSNRKLNIISIVFQEHLMNPRTSFRERPKLEEKKRVCFGDCHKFWKKYGGRLRKHTICAFRVYFMPGIYVFSVCLESHFTSMMSIVQPEIQGPSIDFS